MKKTKVAFICCIALLSLGSNTYAAGWTGLGYIIKIDLNPHWPIVRIQHENPVNPDGCTSSAVYVLEYTNDYTSQSLSLILAAYIAQETIRFNLSGCSGEGFPKINWIELERE